MHNTLPTVVTSQEWSASSACTTAVAPLRHGNTVTVLLITLDAFNKASNNLYKASEKLPGERRPFQFIQETRPVLVLDERA